MEKDGIKPNTDLHESRTEKQKELLDFQPAASSYKLDFQSLTIFKALINRYINIKTLTVVAVDRIPDMQPIVEAKTELESRKCKSSNQAL